ncbi:MAG TPA: alpha/beta hydrolase [Chloroflexota bacterium]|nr:alpha/beta hydrolase [Chloroflexota bacterium]
MAEWLSGDVIANGIRVHYYRTGGTKPPLVLSHGATDDGLCWTRATRALEADYDVIMPDARGHGLSEAPEGGYNSEERAADLAGLIRALHLERPAVGGHSMGAGTSFYLAALYPDLVRCAILEDPGFRSDFNRPANAEIEARATRMRTGTAERKAMSREALIALCREQNPTWSDEELGPWADSKRRVSLSFGGALRSPDRTTWQELLPKITCPVLLITADPEKGSIVTPDAAAEAVRLLPTLKVVRLRGAGHNIRREQFEGFLQAVRTFLAEA